MKKILMLVLGGICGFYLGFSQNNNDLFNIYFKQDFEHNTLGAYDHDEWRKDWNNPAFETRLNETNIIQSNDPEQPGKVMEWTFPKGSVYGDGGGHWKAPLGNVYEEVYFSYRVRFKPGFMCVKGGKLPGVVGEPDWGGGGKPSFTQGFRGKLMWDTWQIIGYMYYHNMSHEDWGDAFTFGSGLRVDESRWLTFTTRIVMNTFDGTKANADGLFEVFYDSVLIWQKTDMIYREDINGNIGVSMLEIVSFFGGDPIPEYAAARDEWLRLDDFVVFSYKDGVDVPRGNTPSPKGRKLVLPELQKSSIVQTPVERDSDTTKIKVEAYGDELNGVNAHFQVLVNNQLIGETDATSSSATHVFDLESPADNNDTIYIVFTNDKYISGAGDRNLYVKSVTYNGYKYYPGNANVVYAFEGSDGIHIYPGTSEMSYTGELVFFPGETSVDPDDLYPLFQNAMFLTDSEVSEDTTDSEVSEDTTETTEPADVTNMAPVVLNQTFICADTLKNGKGVGQVIATDPDSDQLLSYEILSGNTSNAFNINASTGILSVANSTYLQNNDQFLLEVTVRDNHQQSKSDTGLVIINVNHVVRTVPKTNIYYIDPSNINDLSEDGSITHPFDSWSDVNWESGNSYLQKSGTIAYEKKINLGANNITIGAYGEGDLPVIRSQAKDFAMRAYERKNITINNVHLIAEEAISCIYFLGSTCDSVSINNCVFESSNNGVRIIEGKTFDISYNTFIKCVDAIYSFAENNRIFYNVFRENHTAINVNSYLSKANIFNNVFYYNAVGVSASYSELVIYNNIFYLEEQNNQALNYNFDKLISDNNIYYPEQDGFLNINNVNYTSLEEYQASTGLDMNSFTQDPQFIDVYNNNFGLKSTSPAIDAGKDVGASTDFFGAAVPYGNAPDIGLKETQQARNVTGITDVFDDMTDADGPVVYPNPTDGIIQISYNFSSTADMGIIIKDISGRIVLMDQIPGGYSSYQSEIDITGQPTGIYLAFFNVLGKSYMQKIIKK
jgi:hypothetical protein